MRGLVFMAAIAASGLASAPVMAQACHHGVVSWLTSPPNPAYCHHHHFSAARVQRQQRRAQRGMNVVNR